MTANLTGTPFVAGRGLSGAQGIAYLNQLVNMVNEVPGGRAGETQVIAGGSITPTRFYTNVDTEGEAASDNLDNAVITNLVAGRLLLLRCLTGTRVVTIRNERGGSGQFVLARGTSFALDSTTKAIVFLNGGERWIEVARSWGSDIAGELTSLGIGSLPLQQFSETPEMAFNARTYTFDAHGLGGIPKLVQLIVRCKTAENSWSVGDEAIPLSSALDGNPCGFDVGFGATNVWFKTVNYSQPLVLGRKNDADGQFRMTNANWRVVIRAWR